jgi:5,10-methylenetetrahydromethanopterin reductase
MTIEIWRSGGSNMTGSPDEARAVEAQGWDGQMFMDSQCLALDPWVMMGMWGTATERLMLSPGVTNPFTRHTVVTANAAASLQVTTKGRSILGIGRGDSALAYLGHAPFGTARFEKVLADLQTLLRRGGIAFQKDEVEASIESLSLGAAPELTTVRWLPADLPKVPLEVASTGPKVIEMAARHAERIRFSVGAIPERIEWALGLARKARAAAGLPETGIAYGAQLIVHCQRDEEVAIENAARGAAPLARFQVMQGEAAGPTDANDRANFDTIRTSYDMHSHGVHDAKNRLLGMTLDREFVRRFTIAGTPDHCTERLLDLCRRGLSFFTATGSASAPVGSGENLFVTEVMPALRAELKTREMA